MFLLCWQTTHLLDPVAAGHHQRGQRGGGQRGHHGVALLGDVNLAVPAAPRLRWREHAAATAHVAEGCLASAVGTTTGHTRDTRHGTAGTPGLSGGLVASLHEHGVRLALVLGHVGVDDPHDIGPAEWTCVTRGSLSSPSNAHASRMHA